MKKVVIAGSRTYVCYKDAERFIERDLLRLGGQEWTVLSGGCRGADALGERFAKERGWKTEYHLPAWSRYGRAAGPLRNRQMIEACDAVICFWDEKSKGTASLIRLAQKAGKPVFIHEIE